MKDILIVLFITIALVAMFYLGIIVGYNKGDSAATVQCVDAILGAEKTKSEIKKNASETTRNNAMTLSYLSTMAHTPTPSPTPTPTPDPSKLNL